MLGPAERVHRRHELVFGRRLGDHRRHFQELVLRRAADALDHFGRVDRYGFLEQIPDAVRILQRVIGEDIAVRPDLVIPGRAVVIAPGFVIAGEQAVLVVKTFLHQVGRVGEVLRVLPLHLVVLYAVVDQPVEERDVGSLADGAVVIGHRCRTRIARIDDDQLGATIGLRLCDPLESARVRLGGIATHDDGEIRVLDVSPRIRHRSATKRWAQTGHRGAVSDPRLVVEYEHPGAAHDFQSRPCRFVGGCRGGEEAGGEPPVHRGAVGVLGDEVFVAIVLHQARDAVERIVPGDALELVGARLAHHRIFQARLGMDDVEQRGALWAQRAAIGRMIDVAFDVDDVGLLTLRKVALGIHDDAAGDGTISAGVAGFGGADELEGPYRRGVRGFDASKSERPDGGTGKTRAGARQEAAPRELHIQGRLLRRLPPTGDILATLYRPIERVDECYADQCVEAYF